MYVVPKKYLSNRARMRRIGIEFLAKLRRFMTVYLLLGSCGEGFLSINGSPDHTTKNGKS
jgi:hypothetical protein